MRRNAPYLLPAVWLAGFAVICQSCLWVLLWSWLLATDEIRGLGQAETSDVCEIYAVLPCDEAAVYDSAARRVMIRRS